MLAALSLSIVMGAAALVVDAGSAYFEARKLQGAADAAALAAAGNLSDPTTAATAAITAVGWHAPVAPTVVTGVYTPNPALTPKARFVAGGTPNAARVTLVETLPTYFGGVFGVKNIRITRTATAARVDMAAFTLGSRLASLDGGIANQLLGGLLGTTVSLSIADYNALLNTNVDILSFVGALRTRLGLTAASFDQVLAANANLPVALQALADALAASGNSAGSTAVLKLKAVAPATQLSLSTLLNLGPLGKQDVSVGSTAIAVNSFDFLQALLQIGGGGARQATLTLGSAVPGLTDVTAVLAVGDHMASSPWLAFTDKNETIVRTAQTRLYLEAGIPGDSLLGALGVLSTKLPLYVELGAAQAKLSSIACSGGTRTVTLQVQPSAGHASIMTVPTANLHDFGVAPVESTATLVNIIGIKVNGSARVDLSNGAWQNVTFTGNEITDHTVKTVGSAGVVGSIATSLVGSLNLSVQIGAITLTVSPIINALKPVLALAAPLLDGLVDTLLKALGLQLGQADARIDGLRCGLASLVA